jgi:DNA helicase HerA-like ATPase
MACSRLDNALLTAKMCGERAVKIIHGYGSTGSGGAINAAVHARLLQKKQAGVIREFVKGEEFSPFYESARRAVSLMPTLTSDKDFARQNDGVTIVLL